jgi:glycosyltransferase involved in cell wall biosynthesis
MFQVQKPLVSIVIPVYNGSDFIGQAIDSALNQSYENVEIIVVNDGSNDGGKTEEIIKSYGKKVNYFLKENGGVGSALNLGVLNMKGEYFSWLSHDDIYLPNKIEEQVKYIFKNNCFESVIFSNFYLVDESNEFISFSRLSDSFLLDFRTWLTVFSELNGCTLLVPRKCFDNLNFNENLKHTQDYDLWFKIADSFNFEFFPMYLVKSRQHQNQDSRKLSSDAVIEVKKLKLNFVKILNPSQIYFKGNLYFLLKLIKFILSKNFLLESKISVLLIFKIVLSKFKF